MWGIPPADRHSWRSRSVLVTRTQLWINLCLSSSNQVTHLEETLCCPRTPANGVLTGAKWGGVWPEGSPLMGMSSVLKSRRWGLGVHCWSCFRELLSCVKHYWQHLTLNISFPSWFFLFLSPLSGRVNEAHCLRHAPTFRPPTSNPVPPARLALCCRWVQTRCTVHSSSSYCSEWSLSAACVLGCCQQHLLHSTHTPCSRVFLRGAGQSQGLRAVNHGGWSKQKEFRRGVDCSHG